MGIYDFLKRGVQELMIARPDEAKDYAIYKHPDPTIPRFSELTVDADEVAVFFKDGVVKGVLSPGRHSLKSENIPFLSDLMDTFTGGNVFLAELFFVSKRQFAGIKFGGRIGAVEDPKSGVPVETSVYGTFAIVVDDPVKLILGLVGMRHAENEAFFSWFKEQVLKVIRDHVAELAVKKKWPLLDVVSGAYTEEIEQVVIEGVVKHVEPYGVRIVRLGNFVLSIREEDSVRLKQLYTDAAYVRMAGGIDQFGQFAAGKAMMGAGEGMSQGGGGGEGGNAMLGGAALGVGLGMANMFGNPAKRAPAEPHVPAQPGTPPSTGGGTEKQPCGACGAHVSPGKFCAECGKPLAPAKRFCHGCGHKLEGTAKFCVECGTEVPK